ncbi:twin-arginine translocase TatA/TatE family subunit [Paenibacillus piri]|uniref:Sec-independent protein translocase protein TatA n=1 Tax=Paenibacillus piri TaxID=2547395 RepID=A0A4R5KV26_9BACL|nr:twin-arginine translocase TatA/TatE family subunit [Paenibacillus piri]TDF98807.1 twin-arginine translocase TatA/TatE family subunit [Paenibacillus piri]
MGDLFTPSHILLVIVVALLLFGPSKLPELGRSFGKMLKEFKDGAKGLYAQEEGTAKPLTGSVQEQASSGKES